MNCSDLAEDYELYALGVLEEPERGELRAHLARNCDVCTAEVRRAAVRVSAFSSLAPEVAPPKDLRKRVLASVGIHPQFRWNWMQTWATLAACVVLGMFWIAHLRRERVRDIAFNEAMQQVRQAEAENAKAKEVLALLNAPETIVRVSSEGAVKPPQGKVFLNPNRGVLLLASNLPPASAGKIYEMWVIPAAGNPVPAGLFQTESNGTGVHLQKGPVDIASTGAIAVTLENEGGAPQPTSQPIIVAQLLVARR
jgi:anti-sigma-K factor RskA